MMSSIYSLVVVVVLIHVQSCFSLSIPHRSTTETRITKSIQYDATTIGENRRHFNSCESRFTRQHYYSSKSVLFSQPQKKSDIAGGAFAKTGGKGNKRSLRILNAFRSTRFHRVCHYAVSATRMMATCLQRCTPAMKRFWCGFILMLTLWLGVFDQTPVANAIPSNTDAVTVLAGRSVASSTRESTTASPRRSNSNGSNGDSVVVKKKSKKNSSLTVATVGASGVIAFSASRTMQSRFKSRSADDKNTDDATLSIAPTTGKATWTAGSASSHTTNDGPTQDESNATSELTNLDDAPQETEEVDGNKLGGSDSGDGAATGIEGLAEVVEEQVTKDASVVLDDAKSIILLSDDVAVEEDEGIASDEAQDSSSIGVSSSILGMFKVASSVDRQEKRILASRSMGEILSPQQTPPASMGQNEDIIGAASEERVSLSDVDDNNSEATTMALPLQGERFQRARMQPKSPTEEDALAAKYASIESVEERAYQILVDLGMVEERTSDQ